jgi:hypothetical protein
VASVILSSHGTGTLVATVDELFSNTSAEGSVSPIGERVSAIGECVSPKPLHPLQAMHASNPRRLVREGRRLGMAGLSSLAFCFPVRNFPDQKPVR